LSSVPLLLAALLCVSSSLLTHLLLSFLSFFFFHDPATTEIYTLSLHDALPILQQSFLNDGVVMVHIIVVNFVIFRQIVDGIVQGDRKSTRLNSSHVSISYAVFCLKKKKNE